MSKLILSSCGFLVAVGCFVGDASARDVSLRWWISDRAAVSSIRGYNVYISSANASQPVVARAIDVGFPQRDSTGVATVVLPTIDLTSPSLAIEMTAYDASGVESARSNRLLLAPDGERLGQPLWTADFDDLTLDDNPPGFRDGAGDFRIDESKSSVGSLAIASPWPAIGNVAVTACLGNGSRTWAPYEIEGSIITVFTGTVAGVAVRVASLDLDSAFMLGGDSTGAFSLQQTGEPDLHCASSASTGVSLVRYRSYRFRLRYTDPDGRARLRAKVWRSDELEPSVWQADCWTDDPPATDGGAFALYHVGAGVTYWDDLVVRPVTGTFTPIP